MSYITIQHSDFMYDIIRLQRPLGLQSPSADYNKWPWILAQYTNRLSIYRDSYYEDKIVLSWDRSIHKWDFMTSYAVYSVYYYWTQTEANKFWLASKGKSLSGKR